MNKVELTTSLRGFATRIVNSWVEGQAPKVEDAKHDRCRCRYTPPENKMSEVEFIRLHNKMSDEHHGKILRGELWEMEVEKERLELLMEELTERMELTQRLGERDRMDEQDKQDAKHDLAELKTLHVSPPFGIMEKDQLEFLSYHRYQAEMREDAEQDLAEIHLEEERERNQDQLDYLIYLAELKMEEDQKPHLSCFHYLAMAVHSDRQKYLDYLNKLAVMDEDDDDEGLCPDEVDDDREGIPGWDDPDQPGMGCFRLS